MSPEAFQQIEQRGAWANLSQRAKWLLTGTDRVRYLNGQVTNDVRTADSSRALYACITDAKGHINGDVFIHVALDGEGLLLDAEPELREPLGARLERYIVADDVTLADVTDDWTLAHAFGPSVSTPAAIPDGAHFVASERYGVPGCDVWFPSGHSSPSLTANPFGDLPCLSPEDLEALRIIRGVPRFPSELNADTFPPEAGLEERAMNFAKGCYIGQEVLSRIRTTGKMPRRLVRWEGLGPAVQLQPGASLFAEGATTEASATQVGAVTSATRHPVLNVQTGLAYLKLAASHADSQLLAGADTPRMDWRVKISPLLNR